MDHKKIKQAKKKISDLKQTIENAHVERFEIEKNIQVLNTNYRELGGVISRAEDDIDILEVMIKKAEHPELFSNKSNEDT